MAVNKVGDCSTPDNAFLAWDNEGIDCSFFDEATVTTADKITTNMAPDEYVYSEESHPDVSTYRCICGCQFVGQHVLFKHFSNDRTCLKHQEEAEQGFCVGCYKQFRLSRGLTQHLSHNPACPEALKYQKSGRTEEGRQESLKSSGDSSECPEYQQPNHINSHRCPGCFGWFVGKHSIFLHLSRNRLCIKALESQEGFCVGCDKQFLGKRGLTQHLARNPVCPEALKYQKSRKAQLCQQPQRVETRGSTLIIKALNQEDAEQGFCGGCDKQFCRSCDTTVEAPALSPDAIAVDLSVSSVEPPVAPAPELASENADSPATSRSQASRSQTSADEDIVVPPGRGLTQHLARNRNPACPEAHQYQSCGALGRARTPKTEPCQQLQRVDTSDKSIGWRQCTGCQRHFIGSLGLKVHLAVSKLCIKALESQEGLCDGCDKLFLGKRGLTQHLARNPACPEALKYQKSGKTEEGRHEIMKGSAELPTFRLYAKAQKQMGDILKSFCNSCHKYFNGTQGLSQHLKRSPNCQSYNSLLESRINPEEYPQVDTSQLKHTEHGFCVVCDTQFEGSEGLKQHLAQTTDCNFFTFDCAVGHVAKAVRDDDFAAAEEYLEMKSTEVVPMHQWCNWVHKASMMDVKWIKFLTRAFGLRIWGVRDNELATALHIAAFHGLAANVRALVEAGADIYALDTHRHSPEYYAKLHDDTEIMKILQEGKEANERLMEDHLSVLKNATFKSIDDTIREWRRKKIWPRNRQAAAYFCRWKDSNITICMGFNTRRGCNVSDHDSTSPTHRCVCCNNGDHMLWTCPDWNNIRRVRYQNHRLEIDEWKVAEKPKYMRESETDSEPELT